MFTKHNTYNPALLDFLAKVEVAITNRQPTLSTERTRQLGGLTDYIKTQKDHQAPLRLMFVCTHNSRRSVLGQAVAPLLAHALEMLVPASYSGGTEVTACHINTLLALELLGMEVSRGKEEENPLSSVVPYPNATALPIWSKRFDDAQNPAQGFAAIMVCSSADENCPFVPGADVRISLPFDDPKRADGTAEAEQTYIDTAVIIAADLALAFKATLQS